MCVGALHDPWFLRYEQKSNADPHKFIHEDQLRRPWRRIFAYRFLHLKWDHAVEQKSNADSHKFIHEAQLRHPWRRMSAYLFLLNAYTAF